MTPLLLDEERLTRSPRVMLLAGAACISSSAIFMSLANSSPAAAAVLRCGLALPLLAVLDRIERRRTGGRLDPTTRWTTRLAGAMLAGDLLLWSHSIDAVGAGLATVLANLQVIIVPVLARVTLGEHFRRNQALAIPLMLAGVVAVAGLLGASGHVLGSASDPVAGVAYGAGASAFYAVYLVLLRTGGARTKDGEVGLRGRVAGPLYEATVGALVTAVVLTPFVGGFHLGYGWASIGWLAVLAVTSQGFGWLLITAAMPRVPAGVASALLLLQPVGSLTLGAVILGQHPSVAQLAGVMLILAAMILATRGAPAPGTELTDPAPAGPARAPAS